MKLNLFKKKPKSDSEHNQRILDNIMKWIDSEKQINMQILEQKGGGEGTKIATVKINFIREIYKKMNS